MADRFLGRIVVAIDGPAGSGKSSVSKEVARRLGFGSLDTGAAYRALTLAGDRAKIDPQDPPALADFLNSFDYSTVTDPDQFRASVSGIDVTDAIRDPEVTARVSAFSSQPAVRHFLNDVVFPRVISAYPHPGITIEGRDITTIVAPDAAVRILLTASPEVRARRRGLELGSPDHGAVAAALSTRDALDAAVVDFIHPAPGVHVIDTSHLDFDESVRAVIDLVEAYSATTATGRLTHDSPS